MILVMQSHNFVTFSLFFRRYENTIIEYFHDNPKNDTFLFLLQI